MRTFYLCLAILFVAAPGWAADGEPAALDEVLGMRGNKAATSKPETMKIRPKIVRDAARMIGVQSGAAWRNKSIMAALERQASHLDTIFAFRLLLIDGQLLPPVIVQSDKSLELKGRTVVKTGTSYKIIKDARFVTAPPSWRDYFTADFTVRELDPHLLPRTREEIEIWEKEVRKGWKLGEQQADQIFELNMRRLTRDMKGQLLFRQLAKQGYVSLPEVSTGRYAIRVGDKTLDMNQTSFTLSEDAKFQTEDKWEPFRMSP